MTRLHLPSDNALLRFGQRWSSVLSGVRDLVVMSIAKITESCWIDGIADCMDRAIAEDEMAASWMSAAEPPVPLIVHTVLPWRERPISFTVFGARAATAVGARAGVHTLVIAVIRTGGIVVGIQILLTEKDCRGSAVADIRNRYLATLEANARRNRGIKPREGRLAAIALFQRGGACSSLSRSSNAINIIAAIDGVVGSANRFWQEVVSRPLFLNPSSIARIRQTLSSAWAIGDFEWCSDHDSRAFHLFVVNRTRMTVCRKSPEGLLLDERQNVVDPSAGLLSTETAIGIADPTVSPTSRW